MIKNKDFRQMLGITQDETAFLLRTTKSQIAMFELGLRELPATKMLKLATMYNHVQSKQQEKTTPTDDKAVNTKCQAMLEKELKKSEMEVVMLNYELEQLKAKYQKSVSLLELVTYLETELPEKEKPSQDFIKVLRNKAMRGIEKNGMVVQLKCELTIRTAQQYQKELKKELERIK